MSAEVQVETFAAGWTLVPVLGPGAALESATAAGRPVQLVQRAEGLFWLAEGRRTANLSLTYHADARLNDRAWIASLPVPQAAASRFTLQIPLTHIDLAVTPSANLVTRESGGHTTATGTLPASPAVIVTWRVAVEREYVLSRAEYAGELLAGGALPVSGSVREGAIAWQARIDAELLVNGEVTVPLVSAATTLVGVDVARRANAVVYQALHAAEGVLYGFAAIRYEITRGETRELEFTLPAAAQVNHVGSEAGAIADWIVVEGGEDTEPGTTRVRVFLNRAVSGDFVLDVAYEQLLEERPEPGDEAAPVEAPILRALDVARQKGMIALLAGPDLALAPRDHPEMSEVGENQLPAFFRNRLEQAVSHTFKYHSEAARLAVDAVTPERRQGKFNAQVDTLVSIGEVTLKGQVSIENDVKSGELRELRLWLPADLNILGVTGPSIRTHTVTPLDDRQAIDIEFTRDMDGQFRVELNYERIMRDGGTETAMPPTDVPRVDVEGADVVQGRIAIEALAALEVQPVRAEQLSTLEVGELPRQLVLKTTNPILLAYRYVRAEPPFDLQLRITRHREIDVQVAAIDSAHYQTLYTADGLAVTRVQLQVRNARRQFLRLALPPGAEVWSVFVNGEAVKPAFASGKMGAAPISGAEPGSDLIRRDDGSEPIDVLVKMINSATAFPVELVYATRGDGMNAFGTLEGRLPRPDMIVTRTNWDVYVPADSRYGRPKTNMDVITDAVLASMRDASAELLRSAVANVVSGEPLRIELPAEGLLLRFAKLYANQSAEDAHFRLRYVRPAAGFAGLWLSLLATLAIWAGIALLWGLRPAVALLPQTPWLLVTGGALVLILSLTVLGAGVLPPSVLSLLIAVGLAGWKARRLVRR